MKRILLASDVGVKMWGLTARRACRIRREAEERQT